MYRTRRRWLPPDVADVTATQREVRRILAATVREPAIDTRLDEKIDRVVLHPLWGMLILAATLFLMFQAVFSWASLPMELIKGGVEALGAVSQRADAGYASAQPAGRWHRRRRRQRAGLPAADPDPVPLHPALEDSGYLPRAAFLLDRLMGTVGLSGRSFIPLLSSFACAIPGIMAARTITNWRDRLARS
jgi:ferrous iron transport protein B